MAQGRPKRNEHMERNSELAREVRLLEGHPRVARVICGRAYPCRHKRAPGTLEVRGITERGSIKIVGYAGYGVREIYLQVAPGSEDEVIAYVRGRG